MKGFATRAIHGDLSRERGHGALRMPVYDNAAFEHDTSHSIQLAFEGKKPAHCYSRISNPTVQEFEQKMRVLTGGLAAIGVASGMAAISNTVFALAEAGSNIVTSRSLFGNTLSLFTRTLAPWGLEVRFVSMTDPAEVERAIDGKTRAVFLESITNPQLEVADCAEISAVTRRHGVPLLMDNTLLTPYLFNTKAAGVDIELLSSTKYISGGATCLGGVIIDNGTYDWRRSPRFAATAKQLGPMAFVAALRQEVFRNVGACLSPHNAYLQSLGLESMSLRIDKSCANTAVVAAYLAGAAGVATVHYPALAGSPFQAVAEKQFGRGCGGILTFDLKDQKACFAFMDSLQLVRRATNVNDNKTLIVHPFSTIFAEYAEEEKLAMGVRPTMLRLSVGIEDHADIIDDLERGLKKL